VRVLVQVEVQVYRCSFRYRCVCMYGSRFRCGYRGIGVGGCIGVAIGVGEDMGIGRGVGMGVGREVSRCESGVRIPL
jgi:hypothetical protein